MAVKKPSAARQGGGGGVLEAALAAAPQPCRLLPPKRVQPSAVCPNRSASTADFLCLISPKMATPARSGRRSETVASARLCRLSRDNSMASRQNTETEPKESQEGAPAGTAATNGNRQTFSQAEKPAEHVKSACAASRRAACPAEALDPALDPSSLPPPDPSLDTGNGSSHGDGVQTAPACPRDGDWFLKLLRAETARMEGWCQQMDQETKDHKLSEEGEWRSPRARSSPAVIGTGRRRSPCCSLVLARAAFGL